MYKAHFGLHETPFGITPDTSYFFSFASYQAALNTLLVAANDGEGFIKITGDVGTGKTLLCRKFMSLLGEEFVTAYIPNPMLEPRTLMMAIADELGCTTDAQIDQHQLLKLINHRLLDLARTNKKVIVCIDEAQALPLHTLEALRLMSNLETEKRKLLQIVLFGQPELDRKLSLNVIRQLTQRISFHYQLRGLTGDEIGIYVEHRLRVAGSRADKLFTDAAIRMLALCTRGNPRLINILSHKAMMLSFGAGRQSVSAHQIWRAANDTLAFKPAALYWRVAAVAAATTLAVATAAWLILK